MNRHSTVEEIVRAALSPSALVCPRCGRNYVVPGTAAARRYGVCESCHADALALALEQREAAESRLRDYDRRRQSALRARKRGAA